MKKICIYIFLVFLITGCLGQNAITNENDVGMKVERVSSITDQSQITNENEVTLMFVGDVLLGCEQIKAVIAERGPNFPFVYISNVTKSADILFGNLEGPLSSNGAPVPGKGYTFRADPKSVDGLVLAGFDILSLANNHVLDYGQEALTDTVDVLTENGIEPIGIIHEKSEPQKPVIIERNDIKFGFLAYTDIFPDEFRDMYPGPAQVVEEQLIADIQYAKKRSDLVIVSFHWGKENNFTQTERQKELAYLAIDNGAKIVIGHHPHILQKLEMYNEGLIAYSLGNFVSHTERPLAKESVILIVTVKNKTIEDFNHISIVINQDYQPVERTLYYS